MYCVLVALDALLDELGRGTASKSCPSPAMSRASRSEVLESMSALACLIAPAIERVEWPTLKPISQSM